MSPLVAMKERRAYVFPSRYAVAKNPPMRNQNTDSTSAGPASGKARNRTFMAFLQHIVFPRILVIITHIVLFTLWLIAQPLYQHRVLI